MSAREMQIEVERRLILMNSDFENKEKLTSDIIFAFLNAYTERYIKINYIAEDTAQDGTRALKKNQDSIKGLLMKGTYTVTDNKITLPHDYLLYVRSNSILSKNYKIETEITDSTKYVITPNKTIREDNVELVQPTYYNQAIIRNPYVVMNAGNDNNTVGDLYMEIIHDLYTIVKYIDLIYYRKPKLFNVIGVDGNTILDHCELPDNVHMEIVEGAVEMLITEAKYRLSAKQQNEL